MEGNLAHSQCNKPILDDSTGVVREQAPEHCILKVESFSVLQDAFSCSDEKYINSSEFKAGGHTWILCVYPNGNKDEAGDNHLSLSVSLVDKLNTGSSVYAALQFFIYDQLRDNYLVVQDMRGKSCFHGLKTIWGIPKLMPLESFTDASNGFLVNDCCVFGTEVLVGDGQIKRSTMSLVESHYARIYTWKINNFSDLNDDALYSPIFRFGEWSWKLRLFPKGNKKGKGKDLSLYLWLVNGLTHGSKLYTKYTLCINNQGIGVDHKKTVCKSFHSQNLNWGYQSFLSISDVYDTSKGFLKNDTLIVEVIIEVMLLLKDV